MKIIIFLSVVY
jgi:hypothetical protein